MGASTVSALGKRTPSHVGGQPRWETPSTSPRTESVAPGRSTGAEARHSQDPQGRYPCWPGPGQRWSHPCLTGLSPTQLPTRWLRPWADLRPAGDRRHSSTASALPRGRWCHWPGRWGGRGIPQQGEDGLGPGCCLSRAHRSRRGRTREGPRQKGRQRKGLEGTQAGGSGLGTRPAGATARDRGPNSSTLTGAQVFSWLRTESGWQSLLGPSSRGRSVAQGLR